MSVDDSQNKPAPAPSAPSQTSNPASKKKRPKKERLQKRLREFFQIRNPQRDLSAILSTADSKAPLEDRILWFSRLVAWLRGPAWIQGAASSTNQSRVRLKFLLQVLERQPAWKTELAKTLHSLITQTEAPSLFVQTELNEQGGLFTEFTRRVVDHITPPRPRPNELGYVVETIFSQNGDVDWLESLTREEWQQLLRVLNQDSVGHLDATESLRPALKEAVLALSVQATALATASEFRSRLLAANAKHGGLSPFTELNRAAVLMGETHQILPIRTILGRCREAIERVYEGIEHSGVSLDLLYKLETVKALLQRLELVLNIVSPQASAGPAPEVDPDSVPITTEVPVANQTTDHRLLIEIVQAQRSRRSLKRLMRMNLDIFARKLVEHAGETGEHYITRTRKEFWAMFRSGAGGGLVMVPTTFAKFMITGLHMPYLFEAFFAFLNYLTSFLFMQFCHFSLATKQPSMTAAALADKLKASLSREQLHEFAEEIMRISRSQFIAVVGNVGLVVPISLLVCFAYQQTVGGTILTPEYAHKTIESVHPWHSFSILYAVITGVLLWLSSLGSGWLQNWVIYRGLPEGIAHHRFLRDFIGDHRSRRIGNWIRNNASGIGGNVSIAFLLVAIPLLGSITGLPIDIRHVTLSSSSIAVAFASLGFDSLTWQMVVYPILGVVIIGFLNIWVSMALALFVAVRAQHVRMARVRALLRYTWQQFKSNPLQFFLPPKD